MLHQLPYAIHRFGTSVPEMLISGGDAWIVVEVMANSMCHVANCLKHEEVFAEPAYHLQYWSWVYWKMGTEIRLHPEGSSAQSLRHLALEEVLGQVTLEFTCEE